MSKFIAKSKEERDAQRELWYRTERTHRQFKALAFKLKKSNIEDELIHLNYLKNQLSVAQNLELKDVEMWLKNSWNTENVLFHNKNIIQNTGQSFSMQWAFPQAYYSTFCSILAYYKSVGFTQMRHNAVLKKFGDLISQNKYPNAISMYTTGNKKLIECHNIVNPSLGNTFVLDLEKPETIDNQICQLLTATRKIMSDNKVPQKKFKTKKGEKRTRLNLEHWQIISDLIGNTTIMDFLYRKRIQANYLDIETFSAKEFKGEEVLEDLCFVVNQLNLINEVFIAKAITLEEYEKMFKRHLEIVNNSIVESRFEKIKTVINSL